MAVRRFGLISEAEARQIEPGSTVELEKGGHVTPLALGHAAGAAGDRSCRPARSTRHCRPIWRPSSPVARVAIGADHTRRRAEGRADRPPSQGRQGGRPTSARRAPDPVDYPDIAGGRRPRGRARGGRRRHRHRRRRAGVGDRRQQDPRRPRRDVHDADAGALRARAQRRQRAGARRDAACTPAEAKEIVDTWLSTPTREARYLRRLLKIRRLEETF